MQDRYGLYLSVWFLWAQMFFRTALQLKKRRCVLPTNEVVKKQRNSLNSRLTSKLAEFKVFSKWELKSKYTIILLHEKSQLRYQKSSIQCTKKAKYVTRGEILCTKWRQRFSQMKDAKNWLPYFWSWLDFACFKSHIRITKRFVLVFIRNLAYLGWIAKYNTICSRKRPSELAPS